jgi:hypothetical protein
MNSPVQIELSRDESLVLFEWLSKQSDADKPVEISAIEQYSLDRLLAKLEKELVEPLNPNCKSILDEAQNNLTVKIGN